MTLEPLQPAATLPLFPSEARRRLTIAEQKLALQDHFIVQTRAQLELVKHLQTIIT
jgi:hypothetical protein